MTYSIEDAIPSCVTTVDIATAQDGCKDITAQCVFPETFPGFHGHFPQQPILPGIVQLASVRNIVEQATGSTLTVTSYSSTKFKLPIKPNEQISFQIIFEPSPHTIEGKFKIRSTTKKVISSGSFAFSPPDK